jgi:hypothetical protein
MVKVLNLETFVDVYGGHHETLNVTPWCHFMKSGIPPPAQK